MCIKDPKMKMILFKMIFKDTLKIKLLFKMLLLLFRHYVKIIMVIEYNLLLKRK